MRFARHLAAVVAVVAVIVGLGLLWAHLDGGGTGASALRQAPPGAVVRRMELIKAGAVAVHSDTGFQLGNTQNLIRTCVIEAALAAVVIAVSAIRRQQRRLRRAGYPS